MQIILANTRGLQAYSQIILAAARGYRLSWTKKPINAGRYTESVSMRTRALIYGAVTLNALAWAYLMRAGLQMALGLYDRGNGRIGAVFGLVAIPAVSLALSVGVPIWLQKRGKTWLALATLVISSLVLVVGLFSFFAASGI